MGFCEQPDRLTKPLIREEGRFREATWDEALGLVARKFVEIKAESGPDALAFVSSSKCTNEESYLMQKLARAVIGTNNMDNCSRYCQAPRTVGLFRTVRVRRRFRVDLGHRAGRSGADHREQHGGEPSGAGHAGEAVAQAARAEADCGGFAPA